MSREPFHAGNAALEHLAQKLRVESLDSRQLLSSLTDNPVCAVRVDDSVPCITVVWKRYATSVQLRFIHEILLVLLKQNGLSAVLGDDRSLPTIHAEDQRWIVEDWMPRATEAGLTTAANVKPLAHWGQAAVASVQSALSKHVTVRSFDNWDGAREWLRTAAAGTAGGD